MTARHGLVALVLTLPGLAAPLAAQTTEENKAAAWAMIDAINARNLDALDGVMAENVVRHSQSTSGIEVTSLDDMKSFLRSDFAVVPDSKQTCPTMIAEGDYVAVWCEYTGTQQGPMGPFPATGKPLNLDFAGFLRFEEGKIAEMWVVWDNLTALTQLGHVPTPEALFEGGEP